MTAGRKNTQSKQDWNTPKKYADAIHTFFNNQLELDPCSNKESIICAKTKIILPENGLQIDWTNYNSIYINPPYGKDYSMGTSILDWIMKAFYTSDFHNKKNDILMLIPVATNTRHWKEYVFGHAQICFLADTRLRFRVNGNENNKGASMACAMIYYGNKSSHFKNVFSEFGYIAS